MVQDDSKLYISRLPQEYDDLALSRLFEPFGQVKILF